MLKYDWISFLIQLHANWTHFTLTITPYGLHAMCTNHTYCSDSVKEKHYNLSTETIWNINGTHTHKKHTSSMFKAENWPNLLFMWTMSKFSDQSTIFLMAIRLFGQILSNELVLVWDLIFLPVKKRLGFRTEALTPRINFRFNFIQSFSWIFDYSPYISRFHVFMYLTGTFWYLTLKSNTLHIL